MRLKREHLHALQIIYLVGYYINEKSLIKSGVISENVIKELININHIFRHKENRQIWLHAKHFCPVASAVNNLNEILVDCKIEL